MVTHFVARAATKSKVKGPHGKAQQSIKEYIKETAHSELQKRRRLGHRTGKHSNRQQRDVHKLSRTGPDVVGKLMFYDWAKNEGEVLSNDVFKSFNAQSSDIFDISSFQIFDCASDSRHCVVIDGENEEEFICAKVACEQAKECMGGKRGLNTIRRSIGLMKKIKPNQSRGKKTKGINTSYKLFGHRKDQRSKYNGEYVLKTCTNICSAVKDSIPKLYSQFSYSVEKAARRVGNSLFETGVYEQVNDVSKIPSVGKVGKSKKKRVEKMSKKESVEAMSKNVNVKTMSKNVTVEAMSKNVTVEAMRKKETGEATASCNKSLATAMAVGENYWSFSHTDTDFYFSALSVLSHLWKDNGKVIYFFVFPAYKIMIPMRSGDVLLFNPTITHSCSNPRLPDSYIFSSYVSTQTVLTAEATRLERNREIDEVVESVMATMPKRSVL